jgi:hypothetical protein
MSIKTINQTPVEIYEQRATRFKTTAVVLTGAALLTAISVAVVVGVVVGAHSGVILNIPSNVLIDASIFGGTASAAMGSISMLSLTGSKTEKDKAKRIKNIEIIDNEIKSHVSAQTISDINKILSTLSDKALEKIAKLNYQEIEKIAELDKEEIEKIAELDKEEIEKIAKLDKDEIEKIDKLDQKEIKNLCKLEIKAIKKMLLLKEKNNNKYRNLLQLFTIPNVAELAAVQFIEKVMLFDVETINKNPADNLQKLKYFTKDELESLNEAERNKILDIHINCLLLADAKKEFKDEIIKNKNFDSESILTNVVSQKIKSYTPDISSFNDYFTNVQEPHTEKEIQGRKFTYKIKDQIFIKEKTEKAEVTPHDMNSIIRNLVKNGINEEHASRIVEIIFTQTSTNSINNQLSAAIEDFAFVDGIALVSRNPEIEQHEITDKGNSKYEIKITGNFKYTSMRSSQSIKTDEEISFESDLFEFEAEFILHLNPDKYHASDLKLKIDKKVADASDVAAGAADADGLPA